MRSNPYHLPVTEDTPLYKLWRAIADSGRHFTLKRLLIVCLISVGMLGAGLTAAFYWPRTVAFSYATAQNCITSPTLLPKTVKQQNSPSYTAHSTGNLSVAGYPIYAHTTCITPSKAPSGNTEFVRQQAGLLPGPQKTIRIAAGALPKLASASPLSTPISTKAPLGLTLTSADHVFAYQLDVDGRKAECAKQTTLLRCDVPKLGLAQSTTYKAVIERTFKKAPAGTVLTQSFTTVASVEITAASIAPGQTLYDAPTELTLTLNRPVVTLSGLRLSHKNGNTEQELGATTSLNLAEKSITVRFAKPLPRSAQISLKIKSVSAADGGYLSQPYELDFKTSGGPKVIGASIGTYKVSPTGAISLSFDSAVSTTQPIANFVRLEVGGQAVSATTTVSGATVRIVPQASLGTCQTFSVKVVDGLQNTHGISGGSGWQLNSRTICQSVFSIGTSVQGRSITAYRFGSGPSKIVYVGGTHGNEQSSTILLNRWIEAIEANPGGVPAHRTIVIIPNLNPDGYAQSKRTNAHNVDLNRNFPASNWKSDVTMPDKSHQVNGGGTAPLSEPESKALADYITALNPRLVLTYHATGGVVVPNDAGDSIALASIYDKKSNLYFMANNQTGTFFEYDTTGAFEDWLLDKRGTAALLIELWTSSSNEWSGNYNAMWHMAQLP